MTRGAVRLVLGSVKASGSILTDRELLRRFAGENDQSAFAALVRRHTGLVFGVCRRCLPAGVDAEDACQAVFLVLARKAGSVRWQESVASWLCVTARKVSRDARVAAERRTRREHRSAAPEAVSPADRMTGTELLAVLDDELGRLSVVYREPLVLCYLEGLSREEAAGRLGVPPGTVKIRLERGRKRLADALTKRGVTAGLGLLALAVTSSSGASPPRLLASILAAVGGSPPPTVAALAQGVTMNGVLTKAKLLAVAAVMSIGVGLLAVTPSPTDPPGPAQEMRKPRVDGKPDATAEAKERTIAGTVVGPDGKPVRAELHLIWVEGQPESLGMTKADGTFRVTVPLRDPGAWLVAKAEGYGVAFLMPARDTPTEVTFNLVKDVPVRGRVIDSEGNPVAGASVRLQAVFAFEGDTAQPFLDAWRKRTSFRDYPAQVTQRRTLASRSGLPFAATTDKDGRFELAGAGAERLVNVHILGAGRAKAEVHVITREKFDPKPFNDSTLALRPTGGLEKLSWGYNPLLSAPEFILAVESEKPIRGTLTDAKTGKPRAGVEVELDQDDGTARHTLRATSDADGKYVIRGAKKWATYDLTIHTDTRDGFLAVRAQAKDTVGYEAVVADVACPKGVIVRGTARDKATGRPLAGWIWVNVLASNEAVKNDPALKSHAGHGTIPTAADGTYRTVVPPGPVLLSFAGKGGLKGDYKMAKADPKYPHLFEEVEGGLRYRASGGGIGIVDGNWCQVIDAKATDTELVRDVELEPATRKTVRVVDADGRPVAGGHATGGNSHRWHEAEPLGDADALTVLNIEPKEERLVAVAHPKRRLVGTAVVKEGDKNPVVTLGAGGTVTGRVVGADGKPLAGVRVNLHFTRREVTEAAEALNADPAPQMRAGRREVTADANGEFRVDAVFPGYEFRLTFQSGKKAIGPNYQEAEKHMIEKHGDTLKLGDRKVDPSKSEG